MMVRSCACVSMFEKSMSTTRQAACDAPSMALFRFLSASILAIASRLDDQLLQSVKGTNTVLVIYLQYNYY